MKKLMAVLLLLLGASPAFAMPPMYGGSAGGTVTITGGTITGTTVAVSDYQYIPIDAGLDSIIAAPNAAIRTQGVVGSPLTATPTNVTYSTFTVSAPNITSAVWGSGTQTGTLTLTVTAGKLYRLQFTPTIANQVPTLVATSGMDMVSTIVALVTTVQETIYFRASAASAVFTFSNTAASSWSTASTALYEYTQPAVVREYSNATLQGLKFDWKPPPDWNAGTVTVIPFGVISDSATSTAPSNTQYATWSIAGFCTATSGSLSQVMGTAQTSTMTFDSSYVMYDEWIGPATAAITLPGAAATSKCVLQVERPTGDTYAHLIGLAGFLLKLGRTLAP